MNYTLCIIDEQGAHYRKYTSMRNMLKMFNWLEKCGCICSFELNKANR